MHLDICVYSTMEKRLECVGRHCISRITVTILNLVYSSASIKLSLHIADAAFALLTRQRTMEKRLVRVGRHCINIITLTILKLV